jgi:hypothetical protein
MNTRLIDRTARKAALQLLVQWKAGRITNWDFEDTWPQTQDRGVKAIGERLWCFYDDFPKKRINTSALDTEVVALLDRCMSFLGTNAEYAWPDFDWMREGLSGLETLYKGKRTKARRWEEFTGNGDIDVWPFLHRSEHEQAIRPEQ